MQQALSTPTLSPISVQHVAILCLACVLGPNKGGGGDRQPSHLRPLSPSCSANQAIGGARGRAGVQPGAGGQWLFEACLADSSRPSPVLHGHCSTFLSSTWPAKQSSSIQIFISWVSLWEQSFSFICILFLIDISSYFSCQLQQEVAYKFNNNNNTKKKEEERKKWRKPKSHSHEEQKWQQLLRFLQFLSTLPVAQRKMSEPLSPVVLIIPE